ncbi:hypothetical protein DU500_07650 [Haloplanus rubicundus]|uniref:Uncharacterized protein n=1 Tax=Haloplanus rubicundus TaxID=1547898 RepID=A0A345E293_9EURY|nr:hypothetical protein [Haloplanus rubicundus]AXG06315.1 hypothetical protein DU500_07650 [Haloplanus rubicundus]
MSQLELAVDCGLRRTGNVDLQEDEVPERVTAAFGTDLSDVRLLHTTGRNAMTKEGKKPFFFLKNWQTPERIEAEYLT